MATAAARQIEQPTNSTRQSSAMPPPTTTSQNASKKSKGKKATDLVSTSKLLEDTIAQLERNQAGEKDQEQEIERDVKRATRDLNQLLSSIQSPMARIETVQKKYAELYADMKRLEREHVKSKKRADQLQKEKDASRSELSKMTTVKDKLEKLCRELQKENKKLKDDHRRVCETETRMREELHQRLDGMAGDVQNAIDLQENPGSAPENMEADEMFREKFKSFIEQYELREIQFHSLLRTKELEVQYHAARYEQQRKAQEQEANKSRQLTNQVSTFSQTETELRNQLNIYVEKFKQVEDTLNNSNDLFLTFRKEMEEMSKKTKRLEKENHNLTRKHNLTNHNILQMAEERTKAHKEMEKLLKKNEELEKLCRGMQAQGRGDNMPLRQAESLQRSSNDGTADLDDEDAGDSDNSSYEYDDEDEDEDGEGDEEYGDDTEDEAQPVTGKGPIPSIAASSAKMTSSSQQSTKHSAGSARSGQGKVNGQANGVKR